MSDIVKVNTDVATSDKHTPQVGDYYMYNSHGYECIVRLDSFDGERFSCSIMQKDGSFVHDKDNWHSFETEKALNEGFTYLHNFNSDAALADKLLSGEFDFGEVEDADTTALTTTNSAASLISMQQRYELMAQRMERVSKIAEAKARAVKNSLEAKCRSMKEYCDGIRKQIGRIQEALSLIDLYTGKTIEITTLKEGAIADEAEKFHIRQALLYMDEECKIADDNGIDANDIPAFVKWLISDQRHIDQVIPEKKAVIAIKPRRAPAKDYGDNNYNRIIEQWNKYTYFLFRNGDNLYSVDSEDFQVYDRLIPSQKDLERLQDKIKEANEWHKDTKDIYERFNLRFYRFIMFLQGVINSTDILKPLPHAINMMDEESYKDVVEVVYDDENLLGDGRPSFNEWVKKINEGVSVGSRIIYVPKLERSWSSRVSSKEYWGQEHLLRYYSSGWSMPDTPAIGVYELKCIDLSYPRSDIWMVDGNDKKALGFLYEDSRPREWYEKDKGARRKVSCRLRDFDFFLNYDMLSLDDVEYYLNSRIYRTQYLEIMPILLQARKELREEKRQEDAFRDLLIHHSSKPLTPDVVDEAIDWWKMKNKYKRPISKDCTKAMRMIKQRLGVK